MSISTTPWKMSASSSASSSRKALGDRKGINRAGYFVLPMDETLAVVAVDLGGRPALVYKDRVKVRLVGDLQTELVPDFFDGFVHHAGANFHAKVLYGRSNHHKLEAIFKCWARAMRYACSIDAQLKDQLPSTKGSSVIAIFDYGAGNLRSVQNTLDEIGASYELVRDAAGLERAPKIILPGVGHFGQMLRALDEMNVRQRLHRAASTPASRSSESASACRACSNRSEEAPGPGRPRHLPRHREALRHLAPACPTWAGTSSIASALRSCSPGCPRSPYVYFAHSYYVPVVEQAAATCTYSAPYTAVLESGNVFGVQCHPEKSGPARPRHRPQFRETLMLAKRIIPCLDVTAGRVVKGVNFVNLRDAGDPVELADRYNQQGADELVFLDITASSDARATMADVVARTARKVFIPLAVGGGIRSVADARLILMSGADKVSVNTAAVRRPELISELSQEFGAQAVVLAIDARRHVARQMARLHARRPRR